METPNPSPAATPPEGLPAEIPPGIEPAQVPPGEQTSENGEESAPVMADDRILLPVLLFLATCVATFWTGATDWKPFVRLDDFDRAFWAFWQNLPQGVGAAFRQAGALLDLNWSQGLTYMAAVLAILLAHEIGHYVIALLYRIPASLPFFIPVPILPSGTMGAVISMEGSQPGRRQMFDLGLIGPLAGLLVAIPITWIGVLRLPDAPAPGSGLCFHNPLLFQLMIEYLRPDYPNPMSLYLNQFNAYLMAGWMGMFITGLNMLPISQLDGGHVAYSLLDRSAKTLARSILVLAILFVLYTEQYGWIAMLVVIIFLGVDHPPTANDATPLGPLRRVFGWLALLIPILCLSPIGISPPLQ